MRFLGFDWFLSVGYFYDSRIKTECQDYIVDNF